MLARLNHRGFEKRDGTRASLLPSWIGPALQRLPRERYQLAEWLEYVERRWPLELLTRYQIDLERLRSCGKM
ncbi:MAG: hypothetical protein JO108_02865 [Acidobacteriaceae bacterium]|nr:hypothetical protein [Acidobacteriaceae bacterium]